MKTSGVTGTRRAILKPLAIGLGGLLGVLALLVGAWLLWSVLRPPPTGYAPTAGQAAVVAGSPPAVLQYTIDARSREDWAYFEFSRGTAVDTSQENLDWDLAFRRTDVLTNGGETNPDGLVAAVDLGDVPLEEASPPLDGYLADATDDEGSLGNPALRKWHNYSFFSHTVSSKNHTYALRTNTGEVALLRFVSYYCDDGSAGCITFQYVYPIET